jgi:pantoate--beta-alanine ligase
MSESLRVVRKIAELRAIVAEWRRAGGGIGLVPTMGALHRGHISLLEAARAACRRSIVSIFVNPKQFLPNEDLARYPRQENADRAALAAAGCDLLFAPDAVEMYPPGFATTVSLDGVAHRWEGEARPGHFSGVATVVTKLLLQAGADRAFFGEKDYQQLRVVARMARDLDIPTAIVGCPTVREPDGLALSSRNAYLTAQERRIAPALYRTISAVARAAGAGDGDLAAALSEARAALLAAGFSAIDYLAAADADTLEPVSRIDRPARVLAAARLGAIRLIDNVAAGPPLRSAAA